MHFFTSRLVVFNETFASLSGRNDLTVLWHEAISGRLAADVASAYIKCIVTCNKEAITFWADNCAGKNKNWTLFTSLAWCVNEEWGPEVIQLKFLERGHTTMRADSVHGCIGKRMKKCEEIITFDDFVQLCSQAGKNSSGLY